MLSEAGVYHATPKKTKVTTAAIVSKPKRRSIKHSLRKMMSYWWVFAKNQQIKYSNAVYLASGLMS